MSRNKVALQDRANLLFPGTWSQQMLAVRDVRDMGRRRASGGSWATLVREMQDWPGDSVFSMEWLCAAKKNQIRRIVEELAPSRVEVVFTVRDLARTLPAAWQEYMQTRQAWTWEEFLTGVSSPTPSDNEPGGAFWGQQDLSALLGRWASVVTPERSHVVTVPHPGAAPDVLWERMAQVLGIDAGGYDTEGLGDNPSLGLDSAELMRRLNPLTRDAGIRRATYQRYFKHALAKQILAQRRAGEARLALPADYHDWARETAARQVAAIQDSGVHVVGELTDLDLVLTDGVQPEDLPAERLLDASLDAIVALAARWDVQQREREKLEKRIARLERRLTGAQRRAARLSGQVAAFEAAPLRSAVRQRAHDLRHRVRHPRGK